MIEEEQKSEIDVDKKSKRPSDSNFKNQRLPSWNPELSPHMILSTFFIVGISLIIAGIFIKRTSNKIPEIALDYTHCFKVDENNQQTTTKCSDEVIKEWQSPNTCKCQLHFTLDAQINRKILTYYKLTNFYQNHRTFMKSRSDSQLIGDLNATTSDCEPFRFVQQPVDGWNILNVNVTIVPCGAIANSLFNDTFKLKFVSGEGETGFDEVQLLNTGIAWSQDKEIKFFNIPDMGDALKNYSKPIAWQKGLMDLDPLNSSNNGLQNEDLIVWMRNEALSSFRKFHRHVDHENGAEKFRNGLPKGRYVVDVDYNYPVTSFDGTKTFIITSSSNLGGKNSSLAYIYMIVGGLCCFMGIISTILLVRSKNDDKFDEK